MTQPVRYRWARRVGLALGQLATHVPPLRRALDRMAEAVVPAVCPCGHGRGQHYAGAGACLVITETCTCGQYRGPWPIDHLHVTMDDCPVCGEAGAHWAWKRRGQLVTVSSFTDLPGQEP